MTTDKRVLAAVESTLREAGMWWTLPADGEIEVETDRRVGGCDWWIAIIRDGRLVGARRADMEPARKKRKRR